MNKFFLILLIMAIASCTYGYIHLLRRAICLRNAERIIPLTPESGAPPISDSIIAAVIGVIFVVHCIIRYISDSDNFIWLYFIPTALMAAYGVIMAVNARRVYLTERFVVLSDSIRSSGLYAYRLTGDRLKMTSLRPPFAETVYTCPPEELLSLRELLRQYPGAIIE